MKFFEVLNDQEAVVALTAGYHQAGYREGMRRAAGVLTIRAQHCHVAGVRIARLDAHAGDADQALFWLEKACEARETPLVHLGVAWDWDSVAARRPPIPRPPAPYELPTIGYYLTHPLVTRIAPQSAMVEV